MTPKGVRERLVELNPGALFADGLDEALVGIAQQFNRYLPVYSRKKCIDIFDPHGEDRELAAEYFDFNVASAWVGENTPLFLLDEEDDA